MFSVIYSPPAPRSEDGSAGGGLGEECRAFRAWKLRRSARKLHGRNRAEISLSFLEFFSGGARKRKIVRENFCEVATVALAEADGGARAYDSVQSHHAIGACVRCSAGNMFERSRIIPPRLNFRLFPRPIRRRVAPQSRQAKGFRALRARPNGGSTSLAILSICFAQSIKNI